MVFSSTLFLFIFLPVTLLGYFLFRGTLRNYWLLAVSLVFFAWSQPNCLWIILLNVAINYCAALAIGRKREYGKIPMIIAILLNLAILFYFKYFDFAVGAFNSIFKTGISLRNIVLPIGISFFTFQGMSYVIDVYRGEVPVQKNVFKLALYIVLFPQLIAGPIVRYKDVAAEIDQRKTTLEDFSSGIERFIIGLGKKAIIANSMAALTDAVWANGAAGNSAPVAWLGSIAYCLQIFYDFSGYSDMAIGLGRLFGFHFNENFDLPYISKSITEFWRRWHISLSSWFRDYVYIPLGGNRKHVYLNLAIVFLLTGIWHGASWHFVVWGLWNGFFILLERLLHVGKREKSKRRGVVNVLSVLYTLLIVNVGWVLFRAPGTQEALTYLGVMFGFVKGTGGFALRWYLDNWSLAVMIAGTFFSSSVPRYLRDRAVKMKLFSGNAGMIVKYSALLIVFYVAMIRIVAGTYNPFIYFQF